MSLNRRAVAATVAAVTIGGTALAQVAVASPTPGWASTATKAIRLTDARLLGKVAPDRALRVSLALAPRDQAAVDRAVKAMYTPGSATYHRFITPAQWNARYAPPATSVARVTSYLRDNGMRDIHVSANRLLVSAETTAGRAEHAFHTALSSFRVNGAARFVNVAPGMVPASLGGIVQAVLGLNDLPFDHVKPQVAKDAGSPAIESGLYPAQFDTTYLAKGTHNGSKSSVAIMSEGDPTGVVASLRYAERKEHQPRVPVTVRAVGPQSNDTSGADEFDMDTQVSTMVPGVVKHLYLYNIGSLVDTNIIAGINSFVADNSAQAMSASLGGCDIQAFLDGAMVTTDIVLQQAALQGQTFFASSGDNGAGCAYIAATGVPSGAPEANWPCSGEYVVCVGGTSLITDAKGNRISELGWVGSGGGFSLFANPGFWTQDTDPLYEGNLVTGGRAVPDISLDGDPNVATPAKVYVGKALSYVGGTSLSSPMMLGFWARLESGHANRLGFAAPALYSLYTRVNPGTSVTAPVEPITVVVPSLAPKAVPTFTDILLGDNGPYPCLPGYDEVTGLGAPNVAAINKALKTPRRGF
ncbi:MAG TPA: S53 family peptidase [Mycobacteriales bacterium]|nr:S53 family peptidase [Mycobacteriales bacterium]